jgi:hypothetical protein
VSHSGRCLSCWSSAACASGSQAKRWFPKWIATETLSRGGQTGASGQLPRLSGEVQTMHQRPHDTCGRRGPSTCCRLVALRPPAPKCGKSAARQAGGIRARFLRLHVPARASHRRGRGGGLEGGGSVPSVHAQSVSTEHARRACTAGWIRPHTERGVHGKDTAPVGSSSVGSYHQSLCFLANRTRGRCGNRRRLPWPRSSMESG